VRYAEIDIERERERDEGSVASGERQTVLAESCGKLSARLASTTSIFTQELRASHKSKVRATS
jgi:hypothetical protein